MFVALAANTALADDMDLALSRLRVPTSSAELPAGCTGTGTNGLPRDFCPDNATWRSLATELSGVLLTALPTTARTTGFAGFEVTLGGTFTSIRGGESYWAVGSEGDQRTLSATNTAPSSQLITALVQVRKGLPFGFEFGATAGAVFDTELWVLGGDLKWALLEGELGAVPDVALRGSLRALVGGADFSMYSPAVEALVSKRIAVAHAWTLAPVVSFGVAWVEATTGLVDLTPDVSAYDECVPDPDAPTLTCTRTDALPDGRVPGQDFNNQATFADYSAMRMRLTAGAEGRFQNFVLSGAFSFDLVDPDGLTDTLPKSLARQWSLAVSTGAVF